MSQYAVHWEAIGAELGLEHYHIANISKDHHNRTEDGCAAMLMKWLQLGTSTTWGTLDDAIHNVIRKLPGINKITCTNSSEEKGAHIALHNVSARFFILCYSYSGN